MIKIMNICLVFVIMLTGCRTKSQTLDNLPDLIKSNKLILYSQAERTYLNGSLVVMDVDKNNRFEIKSNFSVGTQPKITKNGQYLISFYDSNVPFRPIFDLLRIADNELKTLDLSKSESFPVL